MKYQSKNPRHLFSECYYYLKNFWLKQRYGIATHFNEIYKNNLLIKNDPYYNQLHLNGCGGAVIEPRSFISTQQKINFFYQANPFIPLENFRCCHQYTTTDFINYLPINIKNDDPNPAFGSIFFVIMIENYYFYFWLQKKQELQNNQNKNIYYCCVSSDNPKFFKNNAKVVLQLDATKYSQGFGTPNLIKINDQYYLIISVQKIDHTASLIIYHYHPEQQNATFYGEINFLKQNFLKPKVMIKNFSWKNINKQTLLVFCLQEIKISNQKKEIINATIFVKGVMNWSNCLFEVDHIQSVDLSNDFSKPIFLEHNHDLYLIGCLKATNSSMIHQWDYMHTNCFSLLRKLQITNNWIYQTPFTNFKKLRITSKQNLLNQMIFNQRLKQFYFTPNKQDFSLQFSAAENFKHRVLIKYQKQQLIIDRSSMSQVFLEKNQNILKFDIKEIKNIDLILDQNVIEIYLNQGQYVISLNYFLLNDLVYSSENLWGCFFDLKPINIIEPSPQKILIPSNLVMDYWSYKTKQKKIVANPTINIATILKKWDYQPCLLTEIKNHGTNQLIQEQIETNQLKSELIKINDENDPKTNNYETQTKITKLIDQTDYLLLCDPEAFFKNDMHKIYQDLIIEAQKQQKIIIFAPNLKKKIAAHEIKNWTIWVEKNLMTANLVCLSQAELNLLVANHHLTKQIKWLQTMNPSLFLIVQKNQEYIIATKSSFGKIKTIGNDTNNSKNYQIINYDGFLATFIAQLISYPSFQLTKIKLEQLISTTFWANLANNLTNLAQTKKTKMPSLLDLQKTFNQWVYQTSKK
ncbi:Sucrose-6-phosphate hydrolase [[Mycoplasma] cavipharyngis]|uniref:GH32 C-terminal domain-containing protein n=1 Tax=[Mycoplasma] cavipharyngis TaxID=92757 RepID=UPI003704AF22